MASILTINGDGLNYTAPFSVSYDFSQTAVGGFWTGLYYSASWTGRDLGYVGGILGPTSGTLRSISINDASDGSVIWSIAGEYLIDSSEINPNLFDSYILPMLAVENESVVLTGGSGNDNLYWTAPQPPSVITVINGRFGNDTLNMSQNLSNYSFSDVDSSAGSFTITNNSVGVSARVELVEDFVFNDTSLTLEQILNITSQTAEDISTSQDSDVIVDQPAPSNIPIGIYSLSAIANVFGSIMFLDGLTETVTASSHTIEYQGTSFDYAEVDGIITTVVRDGEFTSEFATEIAESFPDSAGISYSTAVTLIGQANMESTLLMVAGADGNYIG